MAGRRRGGSVLTPGGADVSAIVCTYNRGHTVGRAVESILTQRVRASEVIVVDDGSTDDTAAVLAGFGAQIRTLSQSNRGASAARNLGMEAAGGRWVAFLDSDDVWQEHHLADLLAIVERDPELVWAFSTRWVELEPGAPAVPEDSARALDGLVDECGRAEDYLAVAGAGVASATSTMMVRRDVVEALGGFDTALPAGEDLDLWWRIARDHPPVGVAVDPSVLMTRHREDSLSASARHDESGASDLRFLRSIRRTMERMHSAGRDAAFRPVAGLHVDAIVERALEREDFHVLRNVGWRTGAWIPPRRRALLFWCLATGRPGAGLLKTARRVRRRLRGDGATG